MAGTPSTKNFEWFDKSIKKEQRFSSVFNAMLRLRQQQYIRIQNVEKYNMTYSEEHTLTSIKNPGGNRYLTNPAANLSGMTTGRNRFSQNLVKSAIDTIYAKIGKNAPIPLVTTDGGDGKLRRKATDMNKYLWGKFYSLDAIKLARLALRDACITGTGCLQVCIDLQTKNLAIKRRLSNQVFVDNMESDYRKPLQAYVVYPVEKRLYQELFPQHAGLLASASPPDSSLRQYRRKDTSIIEEIEIVEAWKLPDYKGGKGRHTICASTVTLVDEEYDFDDFPLVFIHYSEPVQGFFGEGLISIMTDLQFRANYTLLQLQESLRLMGRPTWLVPQSANIPPGHLRNSIGDQIVYKGNTPPTVAAFNPINASVWQWYTDQKNSLFELAGISQASAQGTTQKGIKSGVALETMNDIESERFIMLGKQYEALLMDIAEKIIDITQNAWENRNKLDKEVVNQMFKSLYSSKNWSVRYIDWKDVNMDKDQFNVQIFPISSLPNTPAGRQEKIQEFMDAGMIPKDVGEELLDFPDYRRYANLKQSGHDNAERIVEDLFFEGKETPLEDYHDVNYMMQYAQKMFNEQQMRGADDEDLDRLRDFIDLCNDKLNELQAQNPQAPQSQQAPAPEAPQAA